MTTFYTKPALVAIKSFCLPERSLLAICAELMMPHKFSLSGQALVVHLFIGKINLNFGPEVGVHPRRSSPLQNVQKTGIFLPLVVELLTIRAHRHVRNSTTSRQKPVDIREQVTYNRTSN